MRISKIKWSDFTRSKIKVIRIYDKEMHGCPSKEGKIISMDGFMRGRGRPKKY